MNQQQVQYQSPLRQRLGRAIKALALCLALLTGLVTLSACQSWKITPPSDVQNPVRVLLNEYGRHTTVAFPAGTKTYVEFGFGEWHFYGREQQGVGSSLRAIGGAGRGALSRREIITENNDDEGFARAAGSLRSVGIDVETTRMQDLKQLLEERWHHAPERVVRGRDHIEVRQTPGGYHLFRNSNAVSAGWLREMGADVKGNPVLSNFEVVGLVQEDQAE